MTDASSRTYDASGLRLSREAHQHSSQRALQALAAILRNARSYADDNAVFVPALQQLQEAMMELLLSDGAFELLLAEGGVFVNRQAVRIDAASQPLLEALQKDFDQRGLAGLKTVQAPARDELRALIHVFNQQGASLPGERGDPQRPLRVLSLIRQDPSAAQGHAVDRMESLLDAYGHAVFFVDRTIAQLRSAGETIPTWAASKVVQDLVDLQKLMPARFVSLAKVKPATEEYWGQHAANVAVLAISCGARLGVSKRRRHDLGMAALLHDVGVAALPPALLAKSEPLSEREMVAVKSSPLFAARAILRDREVHTAALERAMAAYECHLDLVPQPGEPLPEVGLSGRVIALCEAFDALTTERPFRPARSPQAALRVMQTELVFRFDPMLLDLFPKVIEPLLG